MVTRKVRASEPSKETIATVAKLVANVSIASVKVWLKGQHLKSSANTRQQLERRLAGLIDSGELPQEVLRQAVIGIEESGGKRVQFFEISGELPVSRVEAMLRASGADLSTQREFAAKAARPKLVYAMLSVEEIRMKWSEDHHKLKVDLEEERVDWVPVKKVIVLRINLKTKQALIQYDTPEVKHPHGTGKGKTAPSLYFEHYKSTVEQLLGVTLVASELRGVLKRMIEEQPPIVKVRVQDHTNQQGNRIRVTARKNDVRQDLDWQAMHTQNGQGWAYDSHSFDWISAASNGKLKRDLFSALDADEAFVRVPADCNEEELDYVIEQVRSRQAKSS